jgi:branched-chain amino acid aminotransferase
MDCSGKYVYADGNILPAGHDYETPPGDVSFYEVIRTSNGAPLFFDDHMERLSRGISAKYNVNNDISAEVRRGLEAILRKEFFTEMNVRVTVTFSGKDYSLRVCYIESAYPTEEMINEGVRLILYDAERFDPEIKMLNNSLRQTVREKLAKEKAYEALLVNHEGFITEGSRSNIFFVSGEGTIHTAPDSMVLSGITRKYVTEIIRNEGLRIIYEPVRTDETSLYRSAFITGTSPMVLPVRNIEGQEYEAHDPLIITLRRLYREKADQSIRSYITGKKED